MSKNRVAHSAAVLLILLASLGQAESEGQDRSQPVQYRQEPAPLTLALIRGNLYEVRGGSGANGGAYIRDQSVLVIDAKMTEDSARALVEKIAELTTAPISWLVLTHSDGDHVNGLPGFPRGVPLVAHRNAKRDMDAAFEDDAFKDGLNWMILMMDTGVLPIVLKPKDNEEKRVEIHHFGPAHTDSDLVVFFPEEKVAFVGDLLFFERDPLIHLHKNGTFRGLVAALKGLLALDAEIYLSGHSGPAGKEDVKTLLAGLEEKQAKIESLIAQNKSLEDVKAAFGVPAEPSAVSGRPRRPGLVEIIYRELTEKKPGR
ncbi:MAG: MBL fold metallo-hydrolase [Candidatus Aminicenantes bacterium]|nr:MBL fold metallo-hydrolase [Candidatus Aminicenantes bacterium]